MIKTLLGRKAMTNLPKRAFFVFGRVFSGKRLTNPGKVIS